MELLQQLSDNLWNYLRMVFQILLIAYIIYKILCYLRGTKGATVLAGIGLAILALGILSEYLKLEVLSWILRYFISGLPFLLIVIFQPELRRAFAQLGTLTFGKNKRREEVLAEISQAAVNMAKTKTGALIVIERKIGLGSIVEDAVKQDIKVTSSILESIFYPNSPLHDGAVIIRDDHIVAAHAILPLARNDRAVRSLGTRHRAALGITEETDAIVVVVSEERGSIGVTWAGKIRRDVRPDKLQRYLNALMRSNGEEDDQFLDVMSNNFDLPEIK